MHNAQRHLFNLLAFWFMLSGVALAAPAITGGPNTVTHGSIVTITGSDFETKTTAAPVVWDNCDHGQAVTARWSGAWPISGDQPTSTPRYALPSSINAVPTAHSRVSHYLAGRAYDATSSGQGYPADPMVWRNRTLTTFPFYSYVSWYQRVDPNFTSGDNFKWFDYSTRNSPYTMSGNPTDSNWYLEFKNGLPGEGGYTFNANDDGGSLVNQPCYGGDYYGDYLCNSLEFGSFINPKTSWVKIELVIKYTNQNDGWFDIYQNGVLRIRLDDAGTGQHSYNGPTDRYRTDVGRNEAIGGFSRLTGINNWRYFNDIYLDYTQARVMLGNASTLAASTIREPQPPASWANGSIAVTVNAGAIAGGATAYLYVVDADGAVNATGYEVTIGESSAPTPIDGVCGSNSGATLSSLTSGDVNNCSAGTVSGFTGSGPWLWTCAGINGGDPASCSASLLPVGITWLTSGGSVITDPATGHAIGPPQ